MDIQMTEEFTVTLKYLEAGENVLMTGRAGTGKSTLLRTFIGRIGGQKYLVTAPTGVAALNVEGYTIHRAFGFRPGMYPDDIAPGGSYQPSASVTTVLKFLDVLIVDEISMVRADLFDMMDRALRRIRQTEVPFGGVQLVLVGDLLQLPPVLPDYERDQFLLHWDTPYFFSAHCYERLALRQVELKTIWRQRDPEFVEVLNQVREGAVSELVLETLNDRVDANFVPGDDWVTLTSRRRTVEQINQERLAELTSRKYSSTAVREGGSELKDFPGSEVLEYAVGARVMTVINDHKGEFVNGSFGTISDADEETITVVLDNGNSARFTKHRWEVKRPVLAEGRLSSEEVGSIVQFPVILAWAITIHKSQGKTIPKCHINLKGGTVTDGQFYVALSRAVDLENLRFNQPVTAKNINADSSLVRMIRRESSPDADTSRLVFLSFEGVNFSISQHIARVHAIIVEDRHTVADFGSWINPMSDLGTFGEKYAVPSSGLALAPSLGEFWPLLRRQAAGGLIIGDQLSVLERAVRHQEKGLEIGLGIGYDIQDLGYRPTGEGAVARVHDIAQAYRNGVFTPQRGRQVPPAERDAEGSVYLPDWAPEQAMVLDLQRATDSDIAWAALSGSSARPDSRGEVVEALEIMSDWAISRGGWSLERKNELESRASAVITGVVELPAPAAEAIDPAVLFTPGTRVAFTGGVSVNGESIRDDDTCLRICEELGLVYKKSMSKSQCDLLIAGDVASMSRKAQAAREWGKPIVRSSDFEAWYNRPRTSAPEAVREEDPAAQQASAAKAVVVDTIVDVPAEQEHILLSSPDQVLDEGTRVAFRGSVYVAGKRYAHGDQLQELCQALGIEYKQAVTRSRCDVLVSDAPEANDGKARLAAQYQKPTVLASDFDRWAQSRLEDAEAEEAGVATVVLNDHSSDAFAEIEYDEPEANTSEADRLSASEPAFVHAAANAHEPRMSEQPNLLKRLFGDRSFANYIRPDDSMALISGDTAWSCTSREELVHRLGTLAAPEKITEKPRDTSGRKALWSLVASFVLFWGGAFVGAGGADALGVAIVIASFIPLIMAVAYTVKWVRNKITSSKRAPQEQQLPLERSLGGPVEEALPVLLVDREALSVIGRSVLTEITGLYGWLQSEGKAVGVEEWRQLAAGTLDAVQYFENSGDLALVDQNATRIRMYVDA